MHFFLSLPLTLFFFYAFVVFLKIYVSVRINFLFFLFLLWLFSFYALELDVVFLFASDSKLLLVHLWFGKMLRSLLFSSSLCFSPQPSVLHQISLLTLLLLLFLSIAKPDKERFAIFVYLSNKPLSRYLHLSCENESECCHGGSTFYAIKQITSNYAEEFSLMNFFLRFFQPSLKKFFFKRFFKNPFNFSNLEKKDLGIALKKDQTNWFETIPVPISAQTVV